MMVLSSCCFSPRTAAAISEAEALGTGLHTMFLQEGVAVGATYLAPMTWMP